MSSERVDVRSMTPQERADYTYGFVRRKFERLVTDAERLRQDEDDIDLNNSLQKFASEKTQQNLENGLRKRESWGVDVYSAQTTIDLAMAGLFRIGHVHENSLASKSKGEQKQKRVHKALYWHSRHDTPISVWATTSSIEKTIHGGAIRWPIEVAQDSIRTSIIEERMDVASKEADSALRIINVELDEIKKKSVNWRNDPRDSKKVAGLLSGGAMIHAQIARATKDSNRMTLALETQIESHKLDPNYHRLATLALWTFWLSPLKKASRDRARLVLVDILNSEHRNEAESAIGQFNMGRGKLRWLTSLINSRIFRSTKETRPV